MQRLLAVVAAAISTAGITACEGGVIRKQEIVLPEGDAARGQEAFIALECTACHTIRDMELPAPEDADLQRRHDRHANGRYRGIPGIEVQRHRAPGVSISVVRRLSRPGAAARPCKSGICTKFLGVAPKNRLVGSL